MRIIYKLVRNNNLKKSCWNVQFHNLQVGAPANPKLRKDEDSPWQKIKY